MRFAWWITKVKDTHSEYVILVSLPQPRLLGKCTSVLSYTYVCCLVKRTNQIQLLWIIGDSGHYFLRVNDTSFPKTTFECITTGSRLTKRAWEGPTPLEKEKFWNGFAAYMTVYLLIMWLFVCCLYDCLLLIWLFVCCLYGSLIAAYVAVCLLLCGCLFADYMTVCCLCGSLFADYMTVCCLYDCLFAAYVAVSLLLI